MVSRAGWVGLGKCWIKDMKLDQSTSKRFISQHGDGYSLDLCGEALAQLVELWGDGRRLVCTERG